MKYANHNDFISEIATSDGKNQMEKKSWFTLRSMVVVVFILTVIAGFCWAGPLGTYGRCPENNQSEQLNERCRLRRFVYPRDQNALLQCASATSFDIHDALVRYAYRQCPFVLFLDIVSFFGNDTLDLAEDTFDSIPTITAHLQLWGLTWIIPKNWNELTPFVVTNTIRQLHLVNMRFVPPDNTIPFDLFKGLDKVERLAIFHTELPLIEEGFFDVLPKLSCVKFYNVSIPCTCSMKWFHNWIVTNQFTMIFNGDPDCGLYNTNCYGNGLNGVWILSPDVDTTLNSCANGTTLTAKSISLKTRDFVNDTDQQLAGIFQQANEVTVDENGQITPNQEGRAFLPPPRNQDLQQLDPISLECRPTGFRVLIPLRLSPVTKAEFWKYGNVTQCTSGGNIETSEKMLVLSSNYSSCGTVLTDDEETLTYQNVVVVEHPESTDTQNSLIERVTFSMVPIVCTFMRADRFSFLQTSDLQPASVRRMKDPLSTTSKANVKIEIVNPVASALSNTFSFDIFADAIVDPRLSLMVETLYATPTNDSVDEKRYDIVVEGCPRDGTLKSTPLLNGQVGFRFNMTPFKFRGNATNDVYLHGHAVLCNNFSENCEFLCQPQGRTELKPDPRALTDADFDVVRYSKHSVLKSAEMI